MARSYSECEVLQQDFLAMALPESRFDSQELPRVLAELSETLRSAVCFSAQTREETTRKA